MGLDGELAWLPEEDTGLPLYLLAGDPITEGVCLEERFKASWILMSLLLMLLALLFFLKSLSGLAELYSDENDRPFPSLLEHVLGAPDIPVCWEGRGEGYLLCDPVLACLAHIHKMLGLSLFVGLNGHYVRRVVPTMP